MKQGLLPISEMQLQCILYINWCIRMYCHSVSHISDLTVHVDNCNEKTYFIIHTSTARYGMDLLNIKNKSLFKFYLLTSFVIWYVVIFVLVALCVFLSFFSETSTNKKRRLVDQNLNKYKNVRLERWMYWLLLYQGSQNKIYLICTYMQNRYYRYMTKEN